MKKYGLPYKGSKNRLAERIVDLLPEGEHLIDLFCGGCAVTHAALVKGKWAHVHINDIDWRPVTLFCDALAGRYLHEDRWISREDFFRLKDTDPYVAIVWSFGNNMRDYLYSRQIEPLKRAIHFAMFYGDYEPARQLGHDLSFIDGTEDMQERYLQVKHYFQQFGHFRQQSLEGGQNWTARLESAERFALRGGVQASGRVATLGSRPTDAQSKKKKKKKESASGKSETTSGSTECYRLQYRERRRSLPRIGGGIFPAHILGGRLPRRGDTRRRGHLLRHTIQGNECVQHAGRVRLRGVLRLVRPADTAALHQQLRHARRPLHVHSGVRPPQHPLGIGQ